MAGKKLPKDIEVAAGFFSKSSINEENVNDKISAPSMSGTTFTKEDGKNKNVGGRPQKTGLKNEQFTLTMNPELYEKLKVVANDYTRGNFSALIDSAVKLYCRQLNIDLDKITVEPEALEVYRLKQEKRRKKV